TDETALLLTQPGFVMGTPSYMSPEQARGRRADSRTDIFSAGVVLYELVSASRPFRASTASDLLTVVINEPPRPFPPTVPSSLANVILRCLEKNPDRRYQRAEDLKLALQAVGDVLSQPVATPTARTSRAPGWV